MKIVFLDAATVGDDLDLSAFAELGEFVTYPFSTPEQAAERTVDADIIIVNKVPVNEQTIGNAVNLKLVCEGKSGLSKKARVRVAGAMGLSGFESDFFVLLVAYDQAKDAKTKTEIFNSLQEIILSNRVGILERAFFEYYSNWLNSAIRELAASVDSASPKGLAKLCFPEVSADAVAQSLKF